MPSRERHASDPLPDPRQTNTTGTASSSNESGMDTTSEEIPRSELDDELSAAAVSAKITRTKGQIDLKETFYKMAEAEHRRRGDTGALETPQLPSWDPRANFRDSIRWSEPRQPVRGSPFAKRDDTLFEDDTKAAMEARAQRNTSASLNVGDLPKTEVGNAATGESENYRAELIYRLATLQARIASFHAEQHRLVLEKEVQLPHEGFEYYAEATEDLMAAFEQITKQIRQVKDLEVMKVGRNGYRYRLAARRHRMLDLEKEEYNVEGLLRELSIENHLSASNPPS